MKGTVKLHLQGQDQKVEVDADIIGNFAVHKSYDNPSIHCLTHIQTGLRLVRTTEMIYEKKDRNRAGLKRLAKALNESGINWDWCNAFSDEGKEACLRATEIVTKFRHGRL